MSISDSEAANSFARCETVAEEIDREDRATIVDDSPDRLYFTWLSQECEIRAGPEYIIRKYTFFKNGTFLLLRHHYAEESCSIATHTVTIRGSIKLLRPSSVVIGATETSFHVDTVNIIPLNRQVAYKFWQRLNQTCGPQPRWRAYVPHLIYEQQHSTTSWHGPIYNSLQAHSPVNKRFDAECLKAFGIEFDELKLLRVQNRPYQSRALGDTSSYNGSRFELLLGSVAPNAQSHLTYVTTSLQSTVMIRADTTSDCPICSSISRGTKFSPPLLHEVAALPALVGGYWISERCESSEGGIWFRRRIQIHSGDKLWTARWNYYNDPQCSKFFYTVAAAGSYIQRAGRRERRHEKLDKDISFEHLRALNTNARSFFKRSVTDASEDLQDPRRNNSKIMKGEEGSRDNEATKRPRRSLTDNVHQLLHETRSSIAQSRFAAMLRGHQEHETTTRRASIWIAPTGTTELVLHVAESILIPGEPELAMRCDAVHVNELLTIWPRKCVPSAIEAPSILVLRAKLSVNWHGQYILLLGARDDNSWDTPLRQCSQIPSYNPILRAHLRKSVGLRFGLSSASSESRVSAWYPPLIAASVLFISSRFVIL